MPGFILFHYYFQDKIHSLRLLFIKIKVEVKIKPAAKSKIRRHLCPNKKALSDQGLL